ncbi:MAG: hypothetical protein RIR11_881 [Bacteroidota bacterium]|jgi:hypothetical protein
MCNLGKLHKGWYIFLGFGIFLAPFLRRFYSNDYKYHGVLHLKFL